jgi:hypothetical protein
MQYDWTYSSTDGWQPLPEDPLHTPVGAHLHEDLLAQAGYSRVATHVGDYYGVGAFDIYTAESDTAPTPYVVSVDTPGEDCCTVYIHDVPSLLEFMRLYGPTAHGELVAHVLTELRDAVQKVFRLTHGHGASDACPRCDPVGYEGIRRFKEEADRLRTTRKDTPQA